LMVRGWEGFHLEFHLEHRMNFYFHKGSVLMK